MVATGGGQLMEGAVDVQVDLPQPAVIELQVSAANRALGINLGRDEMAKLLNSIEFETTPIDDDTLRVAAPSFRVDVSRPQDLMEEVARRYGYDNIPTTFAAIPADGTVAPKPLVQRQRIREQLCGLGFTETINYSFIHEKSCDRLRLADADTRRNVVEILNPLTEEQAVLRSSLIPGLLETMQRNISKQSRTLKIFEIGKSFISKGRDDLPDEYDMLAALWTGDRFISGWFDKPAACDFYDLKGSLENLLESLQITEAQFTRLSGDGAPYIRSGIGADVRIAGQSVGLIGEIDATVLDAYGLKQPAFVFEMDLARLIDLIPDAVYAQLLPKFPSTSRDATLIVDQRLEADNILAAVRQLDQPLVEDVQLFDVFQGKPVPENAKSVSLRIIYRSADRTLEDDTINQLHKEITASLVEKFDAALPA